MRKLGIVLCLSLVYACQSPNNPSSLGDSGPYGQGNNSGYYDENGNYQQNDQNQNQNQNQTPEQRAQQDVRGW